MAQLKLKDSSCIMIMGLDYVFALFVVVVYMLIKARMGIGFHAV